MRYFLRRQRKFQGYKVVDMAQRLGISTSYYYKIESGKRNPPPDLAKRIKSIIGDVEDLFLNINWYEQ